jgi:hypothetical protein
MPDGRERQEGKKGMKRSTGSDGRTVKGRKGKTGSEGQDRKGREGRAVKDRK